MSGRATLTPEERAERNRESKRRWRERNKDKVRETMRAYRAAHPGISTQSVRRWREQNPEKYAAATARDNQRRAERIRTDPEYAIRIAEYKSAQYLRSRPKKRDDGLPEWLAGALPKVPTDKRRLHIQRADEKVAA